MATVRVFTAARMQAIEDEAITGARLDGFNLVMIKNNEDEINVGSVRGPAGPPGDVNMTQLNNAIAASHPGCVLQTTANQTGLGASGVWYDIAWNGPDLRDTNSMHAENSDAIVIPYDGFYHLAGSVVWAASASGARLIRYTIDGVGDFRMASIGGGGTNARSCRVPFAETIQLSAGDVLRVSGMQESGAALPIIGGCKLSVTYIAPA